MSLVVCLSSSPHKRARGRRKPQPHDGTIIPEAPNLRWGADATVAWTRADGRVWVFAVDHYTAEAWAHVAKVGDRFAALQPVYDAVVDRGVLVGDDHDVIAAVVRQRSATSEIGTAVHDTSGS